MSMFDKLQFWKKDDFSDLKLDDLDDPFKEDADKGMTGLKPAMGEERISGQSNSSPDMPSFSDNGPLNQMNNEDSQRNSSPYNHIHDSMSETHGASMDNNLHSDIQSGVNRRPLPRMDEHRNLDKGNASNYSEARNASSSELYVLSKNIEVISSKLDALKAVMDAMNQRLANLERVAYGDDERRKGW